jgi:ATP-dependent DNA helicase PIF1
MNSEQQIAFELCQTGYNVFITGSAGVGKTFTIQRIIEWASYTERNYAITATTGAAAFILGGRTIHSYLGIGLAQKEPQVLYAMVRRYKKYVIDKIKNLDILFIDEISMMNDILLTKISKFMSLIRNSDEAFGGVQVILSGDFAQLPSINGKHCFHSPAWKEANIKVCKLVQLMRHVEDPTLCKILEEVRWGTCSKETLKILKRLKKNMFAHDIEPTILFATNKDVDKINENELHKLINKGAITQTFKADHSAKYDKCWKIPESITLCEGAQVVLTWNISPEFVNGSRGVVTKLEDKRVHVKFCNGKIIAIDPIKIYQEDDKCHEWVNFLPLKLAYALTIHKSQGMTLDYVVLNLGDDIFEYGQAYTALSRVKSLKGVHMIDVKASSFMTHPNVIEFYNAP